jgi:hypothetical protein
MLKFLKKILTPHHTHQEREPTAILLALLLVLSLFKQVKTRKIRVGGWCGLS